MIQLDMKLEAIEAITTVQYFDPVVRKGVRNTNRAKEKLLVGME